MAACRRQPGEKALDLALAVRTAGDPSALAGAVRAAMKDLDPSVEPLRVLPLRGSVERVDPNVALRSE